MIDMMRHLPRFMSVLILLLTTSVTAGAQRSNSSNPYSGSYSSSDTRSFGTFFVEYNPHVWHKSSYGQTTNAHFHGVSVGFSYFVPVVGHLGFDAGLKGQYFFRNEKEGGTTYKDNMFSASIPVNVLYDLKIADGFAINPFVGIYGRYNFSAKNVEEIGGTRNTQNLFDKDRAAYFGYQTLDRLQFGWQVGVNFRISEVVTIGGAYWDDLKDICDGVDLHGFNVTIGANF